MQNDTWTSKPYIPSELIAKAARAYAASVGHKGKTGGWIYNTAGHSITQGWRNYYAIRAISIRNYFTARQTAFNTFREMCETDARYSPTLRGNWEADFLAAAFDVAMYAENSPRRSWRG